MKGIKKDSKGITLIALVITIIVLLILAGVTIATLTGENGILTRATEAKEANIKGQAKEEVGLAIENLKIEENQKEMTQEEKRKVLEDELKNFENSSTVSTNGTGFLANHRGYEFEIDSNYNVSEKEPFDAEEWDKTAAPEDVFIWQSDDTNDEGYGVVVGYTANVDNYPVLRYPSRCTKVAVDNSYIPYTTKEEVILIRSYTKNIKKIELPETLVEIDDYAFGTDVDPDVWESSFSASTGYNFQNVESINIPSNVTKIGGGAFAYCKNLENIQIPDKVIEKNIIGQLFNSTAWYNNQPDGLIYVGNLLYGYKGDMPNNTIIEIREGTIGIASSAFFDCDGLTKIIIPNTVTSIGDIAFFSCDNLMNIVIPNSVINMGSRVFAYWDSTQTINCEAPSKPEGWSDLWDCSSYGETAREAKLVWGYTGE